MMFGLLADFEISMMSEIPFSLAWKRCRCIRKGHKHEGSKLIDRLLSEHHPHTGTDFIYAINLRECTCGLIFQSSGCEFRNPPFEREKIGEIFRSASTDGGGV